MQSSIMLKIVLYVIDKICEFCRFILSREFISDGLSEAKTMWRRCDTSFGKIATWQRQVVPLFLLEWQNEIFFHHKGQALSKDWVDEL
jgi:hypothetical protein